MENKKRVHFHQFFRNLHQRLNNIELIHNGLHETIDEMLPECNLLCFDEFHLHDPGDAILIKALLEHLFSKGITLLVTSNYPPDMLLPNPLYHHLFVPSISLIKKHMRTVELSGDIDYRESRHTQKNAFCEGLLLIRPTDEDRMSYNLPRAVADKSSIKVGFHTLHLASESEIFLHFTFSELCQKPTAVMDYLDLSERFNAWLIDNVPPLKIVGAAAQQRFINIIDVLYEKQISVILTTDCELNELVDGVELSDIQRTLSRLKQLPRR